MRTYKHNPADHSITVHRQGHSPRVIGYGPHTLSCLWAYGVAHAILRDCVSRKEAAKYWRPMADTFERIRPDTPWQIVMGDGLRVRELDAWLARRREEERAAVAAGAERS